MQQIKKSLSSPHPKGRGLCGTFGCSRTPHSKECGFNVRDIRKTRGSDCIDLTTCSELFARQLQLTLLRYNIHSSLRTRPPSKGKIRGNYDKWIVEVRGFNEIKKFAESIPLRHPIKRQKL